MALGEAGGRERVVPSPRQTAGARQGILFQCGVSYGWTGFSPVCLNSVWRLHGHLEDELSFPASKHFCVMKYTPLSSWLFSPLLWQVSSPDFKTVSGDAPIVSDRDSYF